MKKQIVVLAGIAVLALGGTATAAKVISGKQIKDNSVTGKDIRDGSLSSADFSGSTAGGTGPQGPAGSAVAFGATRLPGAAFDFWEERSKNVASITEHPTVGGIYCVNVTVPFTNAVASANGGGSVIASVEYDPETGGAGNCPTGTDVAVYTRNPASGGFLLSGFSVVFN